MSPHRNTANPYPLMTMSLSTMTAIPACPTAYEGLLKASHVDMGLFSVFVG